MALWSGHDDFPSAIADLISQCITDQDVINILDQLIGPDIGEIRHCTLPVGMRAKSESGNITSPSDLPPGFNGWIRANGVMISKEMFPAMTNLLESISDYPGKQVSPDGKLIAIPDLTGMIRLNPCSNVDQPFKYSQCEYSMPDHKHMLGNFEQQSESKVQTVKRAAWIWSSSADGDGGKAGAQDWGNMSIPAAPVVHRGAAVLKHNMSWDIPIETQYNTAGIRFKGDTGVKKQDSDECYPDRVVMPVQIYIGKYS